MTATHKQHDAAPLAHSTGWFRCWRWKLWTKQAETMGEEKMEMENSADSTLLKKAKKKPSGSKPQNKYESLFQPCLAEIVGTMFFVFIGCVSVIENVPAAGRLQPALVHGLAVAVLVAVMDNIR